MPTPASRLWMILTLAVIVAGVFWPSTAVLLEQWSDFVNITFTHGWLVLAVCVWLTLRARAAVDAAPARLWPLAQWALLLAVFLWLVCYRASMEDLHVTVFASLLWLAVAGGFGWEVARPLLFPFAFFGFALPSWAQLGNPLQELTVEVVGRVLALTGPPALIRGDVIHIPNGSFRIEEGCSGLHFLIVGLAVAALHGELRRDTWKGRITELVLMTGLALLANWARVYIIIVAGYLSDMQTYLVRVSHYWFGWGVFAVSLGVFFWLTGRLVPATEHAALQVPGAPATRNAGRELRAVSVSVLGLAVLPALSVLLRAAHPPPPLSDAPFVVLSAPWSASPPGADSAWWPDFAGADDTEYLEVEKPGADPVEVFRVRYRVQRQGAELVGESSSLLGPKLRWRGAAYIRTAEGTFAETEVADERGRRSLIWSRYEIGGRHLARPLASQLWYGLKATVSNPPALLIALRATCKEQCSEARHLLTELVDTGALR